MAARSEPITYRPTDTTNVIPGAQGISEFFGFAADCGQAAAEVIYSWASGQPASGAHINAVVSKMQSVGLAGPGGLSTLQENSAALTAQGIPNYVTSDWMNAISQNVGSRPVEIGVSNGRALPGDELNLNNHFLTIVGLTKEGNLIASDPDNAAAKAGQLNIYTPAQIMAAKPWGAIVPTGSGSASSAVTSVPWASLPAVGGNSGGPISLSVTTPSALQSLQSGLGIGKTSDLLWMGGLILLGGLLLLAGVVIFILPSPKHVEEAAGTVIGAAAKAP